MIDVAPSTRVDTQPVAAGVHTVRAGARVFWMLYLVEALVIAGLLALAIQFLLPTRAPLAAAPDRALVREAVVAHLNGSTRDPLIEIVPGATARTSNVRGFELNGVVYYYYIEGARNFDPLSRGAVTRDTIEIILRDTSGPQPLVIYTLLP